MIEAKITVSNPCDIPDLGLQGLRRGQVCWVDDLKARNSTDLTRQSRMGNVRVSRQTRRKNVAPRQPPPPFVAQSRPQIKAPPAPQVEKHVETVIEKTVVQQVDTQKLKAELLGDLLPDLRSVIAEEVSKLALQQAPQAPQAPQAAPEPAAALDAAQLESVLESVLSRVMPAGGAGAPASRAKSAGPEEPLFIPSQIVSKDTKAKIDVKQKATEGGGVDDAQKALRELKRKKRGRDKKESKS